MSSRCASLRLKAEKELFLAAVQRDWYALRYAAPELKADKEIVLAAVQQSGHALTYAAPEMKADKEIVLAAAQRHGDALRYAAPELKAEIERSAATAGVDIAEYVHGALHPIVAYVSAVKRTSDTSMRVNVSTVGGETVTVDVDGDDEITTAALRAPLAREWSVSVAALSIVLKSGQVCKICSEGRLR